MIRHHYEDSFCASAPLDPRLQMGSGSAQTGSLMCPPPRLIETSWAGLATVMPMILYHKLEGYFKELD